MTTSQPWSSPRFDFVVNRLVALHQLFRQGQGDSLEADQIRDTLDAPMAEMSATEEERVQWLSEDLYAVSEPELGFKLKPMNPQAEIGIQKAAQAWKKQDWDLSLKLLRRWKDYLTPARLSAFRGAIWRGAGQPEVSTNFYQHAFELEPGSTDYHTLFLLALSQSDPERANRLSSQVLETPLNLDPSVIVTAAKIFLDNVASIDSEKSNQRMISILGHNQTLIEKNFPATKKSASAHSMNADLLASCYRSLGDYEKTIEVLSRAIQFAPENLGLAKLRATTEHLKISANGDEIEEANRFSNEILRELEMGSQLMPAA